MTAYTNLLLAAIFVLGAGSLIGFFRTKSEGFGRFTTSTLLIIHDSVAGITLEVMAALVASEHCWTPPSGGLSSCADLS